MFKFRRLLHIHHWINVQQDVMAMYNGIPGVESSRVCLAGQKWICETKECRFVKFQPYNGAFRTIVEIDE